MRLVNWNIERADPASEDADFLIGEIHSLQPDLVCLTEAWEGSLERFGGHTLSAPGLSWSRKQAGECKVLIWSPNPWTDLEVLDELEATGSAVTGRTELCGRLVRLVGICIPYFGANPYGQVPRSKPWALHTNFITALIPRLSRWQSEGPVIVAGDFNRRMPRTYGPKQAYELLERAFENYEIVTRGPIPDMSVQTLDHVAWAGGFRLRGVQGRSAVAPNGREASDHFGVVVDFDVIG